MTVQDDVMTPREVAGYLKVAVRTVYALVKGGELPVFKVGRVLRCRRSDVEAFIARRMAAGSNLVSEAAQRSS